MRSIRLLEANTALDEPRINQSNREFQSWYTVIFRIDCSTSYKEDRDKGSPFDKPKLCLFRVADTKTICSSLGIVIYGQISLPVPMFATCVAVFSCISQFDLLRLFSRKLSEIMIPLQATMTVILPSGHGHSPNHSPFPESLPFITGFEDTVCT